MIADLAGHDTRDTAHIAKGVPLSEPGAKRVRIHKGRGTISLFYGRNFQGNKKGVVC